LLIAQPREMQYSTCSLICPSVKAGKNEKAPCVSLTIQNSLF